MSDLDPGMTSIHLHVRDRTKMRALALPGRQITVLIGDRTEFAVPSATGWPPRRA